LTLCEEQSYVAQPTNDFAVDVVCCCVFREGHMQGEKRERWMELCDEVAKEQDPEKVLELVKKLNTMLEEKEKRLGILPKLDSKP
jgi:hypothetical protein